MASEACKTKEAQGLGFFERYLTVWVLLCFSSSIANLAMSSLEIWFNKEGNNLLSLLDYVDL